MKFKSHQLKFIRNCVHFNFNLHHVQYQVELAPSVKSKILNKILRSILFDWSFPKKVSFCLWVVHIKRGGCCCLASCCPSALRTAAVGGSFGNWPFPNLVQFWKRLWKPQQLSHPCSVVVYCLYSSLCCCSQMHSVKEVEMISINVTFLYT